MFKSACAALLLCLSCFSFAMYDKAPEQELKLAPGHWIGQLTYRDYSKPDRMVTLATELYVALSSSNELTLQYVFNDGPGKTVYSYEKMSFDFATKTLLWQSGAKEPSKAILKEVSTTTEGSQIRFEVAHKDQINSYNLLLEKSRFHLVKHEIVVGQAPLLRNSFEFSRKD